MTEDALIPISTVDEVTRKKAESLVAKLEPEIEWLLNIPTEATKRAYRTSVVSFMACFGIKSPEELRSIGLPHLIAWREKMQADGKSVATIKARISAVSDMFKHLVAAQVVTHNPVRELKNKKLKRQTGKTPALSPKQARLLLDAPPDNTLLGLRDRAILSVGLHEGPRRAEIAYLRVKDLHEDNGYLSLWFLRKGGTENSVAIHPESEARIKAYLDKAGHGEDSDGPLFRPVRTTKEEFFDVRHLHPQQINRLFKRWSKVAEITVRKGGITAHSMRATAATQALRKGAPIDNVQYMLGHADSRTTLLYDKRKRLPENSASFATNYDAVEKD